MQTKTIKVALADDHTLLRNALADLIDNFDDFKVVYQAGTGKEIVEYLKGKMLPDIVLLDLSMPEMDGYDTALYMQREYPNIHILMLTMYDSELTLIRLLQAGVKGFLKKDIAPGELKFAINSVMQTGYYYSTHTAGRLANLFRNNSKDNPKLQDHMLSDHEIKFLKLACSDLTYKEIAQSIGFSPRAVDALRENLF